MSGGHELLLGWLDDPSEQRGVRFRSGGWQRLTYRELAERTLRAAAYLAESGVRAGDLVPLVIPPGPDFVASFFGLLAIGATPSVLPLPWAVNDAGYEARLRSIGKAMRPRRAVVAEPYREQAEQMADGLALLEPSYGDDPATAPRARGDLALVQFTSGSCGDPRGLKITTGNLAANLEMIHDWVGVGGLGGVSWLPLHHDMGLVGGLLAALTAQVEHALMRPEDFIRDTPGWLAEYGREGYAYMFMPNFGFERVLAKVRSQDLAGLDFSRLTAVISGAERVDPGTMSRFVGLLEPHGFDIRALAPAYGLAEATLAVTGVRRNERPRLVRLSGSALRLGEKVEVVERAELRPAPVSEPWSWHMGCGRPMDGLTVQVVDDDGTELPERALGEIVIEGSSVATGYLDGQRLEAGRLATKDAGFILDGELFVIGRLGDSLKVNGGAVFVEDIEAELLARTEIPQRSITAAGGMDGGRPTVLVVTERDLGDGPGEIAEVVRGHTGSGACLKVLQAPRGTIKLTSSGKPRRRALWLRYLAGELPGRWLLDEGGKE